MISFIHCFVVVLFTLLEPIALIPAFIFLSHRVCVELYYPILTSHLSTKKVRMQSIHPWRRYFRLQVTENVYIRIHACLCVVYIAIAPRRKTIDKHAHKPHESFIVKVGTYVDFDQTKARQFLNVKLWSGKTINAMNGPGPAQFKEFIYLGRKEKIYQNQQRMRKRDNSMGSNTIDERSIKSPKKLHTKILIPCDKRKRFHTLANSTTCLSMKWIWRIGKMCCSGAILSGIWFNSISQYLIQNQPVGLHCLPNIISI